MMADEALAESVERAGADVAEHDADRAERQPPDAGRGVGGSFPAQRARSGSNRRAPNRIIFAGWSNLGAGSTAQRTVYRVRPLAAFWTPPSRVRMNYSATPPWRSEDGDETGLSVLIKLFVRARAWRDRLKTGEIDVKRLAAADGIYASYISRALRPAFLSPAMVDAILGGDLPPEIDVASLIGSNLAAMGGAAASISAHQLEAIRGYRRPLSSVIPRG